MFKGICLVALAVVAASLPVSSAHAGVQAGENVILINGGWLSGSAEGGQEIDGGAMNFEWHRRDWAKPFSGGIALGYGQIHKKEEDTTSRTDRTLTSIPLVFTGRYWLGQGKAQGYIGAGLGLYFTSLDVSTSDDSASGGTEYSSETAITGGMAFPVGLAISIGEKLLLNGWYQLNWLWSNEFLENDMLHGVGIGLGIHWE